MTLQEYMQAEGLSDAELAARLGVGRQTVFRWRRGQAIPGRAAMQAIHRETGGSVTADDFYGLPLPKTPAGATGAFA